MKKLLLILLFIPLLSNAQYKGDKANHFIAGAFVGGVGYTVAKICKTDNKTAKKIGTIAALFVGGIKELSDKNNGARFDTSDLLFTGLGGFAVSFSLESLAKSNKKTIF